jgi:hypothetical protein
MDLKMAFDEVAVLTENLAFISSNLGVPDVVIVTTSDIDTSVSDEVNAAEKSTPGKPTTCFTFAPEAAP